MRIYCTRLGDWYVNVGGSANLFDSLWQSFIGGAISKTALSDRFQKKDLRQKTATDTTIEGVQALLGHYSQDITRKNQRLGVLLLDHTA